MIPQSKIENPKSKNSRDSTECAGESGQGDSIGTRREAHGVGKNFGVANSDYRDEN
jgi:hypothetical protein